MFSSRKGGSFVVMEFFFFSFFCPSPLLSSFDLFRCWKFWAGFDVYMFTCKGKFLRGSD